MGCSTNDSVVLSIKEYGRDVIGELFWAILKFYQWALGVWIYVYFCCTK